MTFPTWRAHLEESGRCEENANVCEVPQSRSRERPEMPKGTIRRPGRFGGLVGEPECPPDTSGQAWTAGDDTVDKQWGFQALGSNHDAPVESLRGSIVCGSMVIHDMVLVVPRPNEFYSPPRMRGGVSGGLAPLTAIGKPGGARPEGVTTVSLRIAPR